MMLSQGPDMLAGHGMERAKSGERPVKVKVKLLSCIRLCDPIRDSDGFRWGSVPVVLPGVATAAGNAQGAQQGRG